MRKIDKPQRIAPPSAPKRKDSQMPLVISYARYSSSAQINSDSMRRQIAQSKVWAEAQGVVIDESLRDESVSAFKGANAETGALASILRRIERNEIREGSILLVESLDRLSRQSVRKALSLFLGIIDGGVKIVTLADGREYSPDKCDELELIQSIMIMSRAHEESAIKSHRSKANWERRRQLAKEGGILSVRLPSWCILENGKIKLDKAKSAAVRYCFDLALKGFGVGAIVRKLNAENIKSIAPARKDRSQAGSQWYTRFVWRLFSEPAAIGVKEVKKINGKQRIVVDRIDGYYPPVISTQIYERVQALMSSRRGQRTYGKQSLRHHNFFNGLLKDEHGDSYTTFHRKAAAVRYLVSIRAFSKKCGNLHYLRQDIFEQAFFETLLNHSATSFLSDSKGRNDALLTVSELDAVEKQLADIEQQLVDLNAPAAALRVMDKLEVRRKGLQAKVKAERIDGSLSDEDRISESLERMRALLTGEATNEERIEMGGIVRQLVTGAVLKVWADGMMRGDCTLSLRAGGSLRFVFEYSNSKRVPNAKKLDTLEVKVVKPIAP